MFYLRERWRLLLVLGVLGVVVWAAGIYSYLPWTNRRGAVTLANVNRIDFGMSIPELETLLGGPGQPEEGNRQCLMWTNGEMVIWVRISDDGHVLDHKCKLGSASLWYYLRRRLHI